MFKMQQMAGESTMHPKTIVLVTACILAMVVAPALAKRIAPKPVAPVTKDGIEYSAPLDREGFVVATWIKTKREVWSRQVYVIKRDYGLEADVQTCFITKLEIQDGVIHIWNERGAEFELDMQKLDVRVVKGQPVIDYTDRKPPAK